MTSDIQRRHCHTCNSQRKDLNCWKCGSETTVPCAGWDYPEMPPIDLIRQLAKEVGYAIGEHGSRERDMDLIAAPWAEDAVSADCLLEHLAENLVFNGHPAEVRRGENKPLGRYAVNIVLHGWFKIIDLSICPMIKESENKSDL